MNSASYYNDKINHLNRHFYLVLRQAAKNCAPTNSKSDVLDDLNDCVEDRHKLQGVNEKILFLKKSIDVDNNTLTSYIKDIDEQISYYQEENAKLEQELDDLTTGKNTSIGLINDKQELYNANISKIIFITSAIVFMSVIIYKQRR